MAGPGSRTHACGNFFNLGPAHAAERGKSNMQRDFNGEQCLLFMRKKLLIWGGGLHEKKTMQTQRVRAPDLIFSYFFQNNNAPKQQQKL